MENYLVSVDITMSKNISVEANSEEEAMDKVNRMINNNPYDFCYDFSHFVSHEVIDAEPTI